MQPLGLIPLWRLEYEPPGICHGFDLGVGELLGGAALLGGTEAAAAPLELGAAGIGAAEAGAGAAGFGSTIASTAASTGILGSGIGLGDIGAVTSVGGTLLSAKAQMDQADYAKKVAALEAQGLRDKANQDAAAGEQAQIQQNRKTELVLSRARSLAASSGTSANSGDVVNTEAQIAGQGNYNALTALYEGQAAARSDNQQADIALFRGQQAGAALPYQVGGTLLSGISNFATNRARLRYYSLGGGNGAGI